MCCVNMQSLLLNKDIYRIVHKYIYDCVVNDLRSSYRLLELNPINDNVCCQRILNDTCSKSFSTRNWIFMMSKDSPSNAMQMAWPSDLDYSKYNKEIATDMNNAS